MTLDDAIMHYETKTDCTACGQDHAQLAEWLRELKRYREFFGSDKGTILPCKIGDTLYTNVSHVGWYLRKKDRPYKAEVVYIGLSCTANNYINVQLNVGKKSQLRGEYMLRFNFDEIGERIFLTKEEAEKQLKRLEILNK